MQAKLLTLTQRPSGHWVSTWRTSTGSRQVHMIPAGADLEKALTMIHKRLNATPPKGI